MSTPGRERVAILDPLRGIAALAVAWYHLTSFPRVAIPGSMLERSGSYGWLGLDVFFVISGFIIPLTMDRAGYQLRDYGRFVLKRILRLDPPYLVAIALMLLAWRATAWLGMPVANTRPVSGIQLLLHLAYLNAFFGYPWIIGVALDAGNRVPVLPRNRTPLPPAAPLPSASGYSSRRFWRSWR